MTDLATKVPNALRVTMTVVTPRLAERWLASNTHNRKLRKHRVTAYALAMERGEWQPAGDSAIVLDADGRILNGQHRLAAVVMADTPQVFMVLRGVAPKTQEVMDRGLTRSMGDALALRGEHNVNNLASALRWHYRLDYIEAMDGTVAQFNLGSEPTVPTLLAVLDENPDIRDSVKSSAVIVRAIGSRNSTTAAVHYRCAQVDRVDCDDFFAKLTSGIGLVENDPIGLLRNTIIADGRGTRRMPDYRECALMIKAWNYYREGAQPRALSFKFGGRNQERFPQPR